MIRLISYLAPSIPEAFFSLVAEHIETSTGVRSSVVFEKRISGPLAGDDDPFADGRVDIGFICAPSVRFLGDEVSVMPSLVPNDPRANGRPVYFADVVVRATSSFRTFDDLRGATYAYNDPNSKSGWFSMIERVGSAGYFGRCVQSGSHLRSLEMVASGDADVAAIDSNVLRLQKRDDLRVIESWGPFPIQPVVVRSGLDAATKQQVTHALLTMHEKYAASLDDFGFSRFVESDPDAYRR